LCRYARVRAAEEGRNGLVITAALYGQLEASGGGLLKVTTKSCQIGFVASCQIRFVPSRA
jgi:hypothetical protein